MLLNRAFNRLIGLFRIKIRRERRDNILNPLAIMVAEVILLRWGACQDVRQEHMDIVNHFRRGASPLARLPGQIAFVVVDEILMRHLGGEDHNAAWGNFKPFPGKQTDELRVTDPISGLLRHLTDHRLARRLTRFDMAAHAIPQPLVGREAAVQHEDLITVQQETQRKPRGDGHTSASNRAGGSVSIIS